MKTRLDTAKETLAKRMSEINKNDISYDSPLGAHKRAILSDIFYDVFNEAPTKKNKNGLTKKTETIQFGKQQKRSNITNKAEGGGREKFTMVLG